MIDSKKCPLHAEESFHKQIDNFIIWFNFIFSYLRLLSSLHLQLTGIHFVASGSQSNLQPHFSFPEFSDFSFSDFSLAVTTEMKTNTRICVFINRFNDLARSLRFIPSDIYDGNFKIHHFWPDLWWMNYPENLLLWKKINSI